LTKESDPMQKMPVYFFILLALVLFPVPSRTYLPGTGDILGPLMKAAAGTETIQARETFILFEEETDQESRILAGEVFMKSPDACRFETGRPGGIDVVLHNGRRSLAMLRNGRGIRDSLISTLPAFLFLEKPLESLLNDLSFLGIRTGQAGLERLDGKIAFVIGKTEDELPGSRLWIDKGTGLPLRFEGFVFHRGRRIPIRADFESYQDIRKGVPFPKEISYFLDGLPVARSVFTNLSRNVPLSDDLFAVPRPGASPYPPLSGFLDPRQ